MTTRMGEHNVVPSTLPIARVPDSRFRIPQIEKYQTRKFAILDEETINKARLSVEKMVAIGR